jgi:hypothetical protein
MQRRIDEVLASHAALLEVFTQEIRPDPARRRQAAPAMEIRWALARQLVQQLRALGSRLADEDLALAADLLRLDLARLGAPDSAYHVPDFLAEPPCCRVCGARLRGDAAFLEAPCSGRAAVGEGPR